LIRGFLAAVFAPKSTQAYTQKIHRFVAIYSQFFHRRHHLSHISLTLNLILLAAAAIPGPCCSALAGTCQKPRIQSLRVNRRVTEQTQNAPAEGNCGLTKAGIACTADRSVKRRAIAMEASASREHAVTHS
jgi:hypothetical protein